ncbi:3-deoxy-D-manno-octulosonic acid kinase [Alteromonas sediminis]|uniref:3-deoxy-D-manno-octulosonic acid kinase n=1 Tax=Alteromonas sediminis TaxID=2259342 RepID=UPI00140554F7|nr:3-deoxy-D-manno-octulosonic acid kinase [Alteromonas sediminis]
MLIDIESCRQLDITPIAAWFNTDFWRENNAITGVAEGRGTTLFVEHQAQAMVLRHYCRGGMVRHLNHDIFFGFSTEHTRPFQELSLLRYMHSCHLPVPTGIAGLVSRVGCGYRADLVTARIPDATDIHQLISQAPISEEAWARVGQTIKKMHQAQVYHHDLNIKNIMLDNHEQVWLIDFDKCRKQEGNEWKQSNLNRLLRSLNKQKTKFPDYCFEPQNWQALVQGYHE